MKNYIIILLSFFIAKGTAQSLQDAMIEENVEILQAYIVKNGPNRPNKGLYPIMVAAKLGQVDMVTKMIKKGTNINAIGAKKKTALMMAAHANQVEVGQLLMQNRANIILKDRAGNTAMDIARKAGHKAFQNMVRANLKHYAQTDGPYVFQEGNTLKAYYIKGTGNQAQVKVKDVSQSPITCTDTNGKPLFNVKISKEKANKKWEYEDAPVYAISDIEGNLPALIHLLKAGKVMDNNFSWTFGEGHLVLVGDFFDRGEQVTECLWLIYKLEQEARAAGGQVHFIIGNHEYMNLSGDTRFVRMKYKSNAALMKKRYDDLFSKSTVLGQWLRTKPAMIRIGNVLFTHAGISPSFASQNMNITTSNQILISNIDCPLTQISGKATCVLGKKGLLWNRDMAREKLSSAAVQQMLSNLGAKTVVIGHTKVKNITALYGGQVINIDVDHTKGKKHQKALLIQNGVFYSVNTAGEKRTL